MAQDPICGMSVNPNTAIKLVYQSKDYFFCSQHCKDKFVQREKITQAITCAPARAGSMFKNKVFLVGAVSVAALSLSYVLPVLEPFQKAFLSYVRSIWWAVCLGLLLGGAIDFYVPQEYISKILARKNPRTIINAVFLGFLMSACSHGILALSIQLHKKGASNPAVVSFLLASPWANFAITIMLLSLFGIRGFLIIIAALIIAITTGFIFMFLEKKGLIEKNTNSIEVGEGFSIASDIRRRMREYTFSRAALRSHAQGVWRGAMALANMVLWWIILGVLIASVAGAYIPVHIFHRFMGPSIMGLLVTLLLATVIEVCSEGSSPLAFEIYRQTGALGNSFVFLMAGVATDYTEIGLLWTNVGRRTALWLPLVTVPQIVALGYIINIFWA